MRVNLPMILGCGWVALSVGCNEGSGNSGFDPTEAGIGSSGSSGAAASTGSTTSGLATTTTVTGGESTAAPTSTSSTGAGATTMSVAPCSSDQDCQDSPDGPICDPDTKTCTTPCRPGALP